jgi:hypothetical protein
MAGTSQAMTAKAHSPILVYTHPTRDGIWSFTRGNTMSNGDPLSLSELEQRVADVRDNIRQLIEQAAAFSGAGDEARNADRLAQQNEELERLTKQRDALAKK